MRKLLLTAWLLMPVAALAYHYGPGQDQLLLDEAAELIAEAEVHVERAQKLAETDGDFAAEGAWADAEAAYEEALGVLPDDRVAERQRLRLERAKCQMFISELPEANRALQGLVDELAADEAADAELLRDTRSTYANSQYYMTWLMRLEGSGREAWEPRIESARQTFKLLAEDALANGSEGDLAKSQENLESTVRLARMDLTELQGLPLPSQ